MLENQILCFLVFNLHYQNKFHKYEVKLTFLLISTKKIKFHTHLWITVMFVKKTKAKNMSMFFASLLRQKTIDLLEI